MEFWTARDLMPMLGYAKWQKFVEAIERAKVTCKMSEQSVENHFLPAPVKSTGGRPKEAMNAEVIKNSEATRQTLLSRDIKPEHIKPEEDLKHVEARRKKERKELQNGLERNLIEE